MTGIDTIGAQARPQHDPVQRLSGRTASSMDADPLVSVIIPCYNGEAFLKEAIESALAQRYPPDPAISPGIVDPDALANDAGAGRAQSHNLQRRRRSRTATVTKDEILRPVWLAEEGPLS